MQTADTSKVQNITSSRQQWSSYATTL